MPLDKKLMDEAREKLFSGVVNDVLDSLDYRDQAMYSHIRPLDEDLVLFGPARTAQWMPVADVEEGENPYEGEIALVDDLNAGDVIVMACAGSMNFASWGELLSTAAAIRGAAGCVTDGLVRDVRVIREMKFPVFHGGIRPLESRRRGKIMAIDVPAEAGGVRTCRGDLVFGDVDGVVVIPSDVAKKVVELALEKVEAESVTRQELRKGLALMDVYEKYGVL